MSWSRLRTAQGVMGQSSFTEEGNIHRESTVARYSLSAAATAGGSANLRMEVFTWCAELELAFHIVDLLV